MTSENKAFYFDNAQKYFMPEEIWEGRQKRKSSKLFNYVLGSLFVLISIIGIILRQSVPGSFKILIPITGIIGIPLIVFTEINFRGKRYSIDDSGITEKFDWIILKENRIKFDQITNISISKGFFDRKYNTGSINVHTAGMGSQKAEIEIRYIEKPEDVKDILEKEM